MSIDHRDYFMEVDRADLIEVLHIRFGSVPQETVEQIWQVDRLETLERLVLVAANVPDWATMTEEITCSIPQSRGGVRVSSSGNPVPPERPVTLGGGFNPAPPFRIVGEEFNPVQHHHAATEGLNSSGPLNPLNPIKSLVEGGD